MMDCDCVRLELFQPKAVCRFPNRWPGIRKMLEKRYENHVRFVVLFNHFLFIQFFCNSLIIFIIVYST